MVKKSSRSVRRALKRSRRLARSARLSTALIGAVALISPCPGIAAGAADAPGSPALEPTTLKEVTVVALRLRPKTQTTATGLEMQLVDTPQAVSIVTPQMMNLIGASDIYEAAYLVPGLNQVGRGYGLDHLALRGIPVERRINGALFSSLHSVDQFAVERTEVVRGPATALYGVSGNFGGEINSVLKEPVSGFHSEVGYENGTIGLKQYEADVNGAVPGTDGRLTARLVGDYRLYGAPVDVVSIRNNHAMAMGALKYELSDSTVARAWLYYDRVSEDPYDGGFTQKSPSGALVIPNISPDRWYYGDPRYDQNVVNEIFAIANVSHEFSDRLHFEAQVETDRIGRKISEYFPFGPAGAYSLPEDQVYFYSYDQRQHEKDLTFDASLGGKFDWLGHEQQFLTAIEYQGAIDPAENVLLNSVYLGNINIYDGGRGILADGTPVPLVDRSTLHVASDTLQTSRNYRASEELLLTPFDRLQLLLGAMFQRTTIDTKVPISGSKVLTPPRTQSETFDKTVPRAAVTYALLGHRGAVDELKAYFNYSEGFQPNTNAYDVNGRPITTPQLMNAYELGLKGEFMNHALGSSLALYDESVTNIPVVSNEIGSFSQKVSRLQGLHKVKGIEWEMVGRLLPGVNVVANYAYTVSKIVDPNYDFTIPFPEVPKHQFGVYLTYELLSGPARGLTLGINDVTRGPFTWEQSLVEAQRFGQYTHGGYSVVGVAMSYDFQAPWAKGLEVYFNGNNIFNKIVYLQKEDTPAFAITREQPMQYIFGIRYRF